MLFTIFQLIKTLLNQWHYEDIFNKKENVKINPNNSKFISICQMVWFSDIRLYMYKMWRAGKFLAGWLHWSVVRGNTKSKQVLMTYILICTIQFFTTFWKKKIAWKCGSQLVIHITRHFNGVNELSDHFTRV